MKTNEPFWVTGVNPITGYKLEPIGVLKSEKIKQYKIRKQLKLKNNETS